MNERIWNQRMLGLTFNVEDGRITIFRSTLEALGWPTHYRFLYNREAKQVAVQNCMAEDAGAHKTPIDEPGFIEHRMRTDSIGQLRPKEDDIFL